MTRGYTRIGYSIATTADSDAKRRLEFRLGSLSLQHGDLVPSGENLGLKISPTLEIQAEGSQEQLRSGPPEQTLDRLGLSRKLGA